MVPHVLVRKKNRPIELYRQGDRTRRTAPQPSKPQMIEVPVHDINVAMLATA
jgi:hypothetical protein